MIRGTPPPEVEVFDWATRKIDLQTQTKGKLPENALPPGLVQDHGDAEIPTGEIDGENKVFMLNNVPNPPSSLQLFTGFVLTPVEDYTLAGKRITLVSAPLPNSNVIAWYRF